MCVKQEGEEGKGVRKHKFEREKKEGKSKEDVE